MWLVSQKILSSIVVLISLVGGILGIMKDGPELIADWIQSDAGWFTVADGVWSFCWLIFAVVTLWFIWRGRDDQEMDENFLVWEMYPQYAGDLQTIHFGEMHEDQLIEAEEAFRACLKKTLKGDSA